MFVWSRHEQSAVRPGRPDACKPLRARGHEPLYALRWWTLLVALRPRPYWGVQRTHLPCMKCLNSQASLSHAQRSTGASTSTCVARRALGKHPHLCIGRTGALQPRQLNACCFRKQV
jgi:hypothetical protein